MSSMLHANIASAIDMLRSLEPFEKQVEQAAEIIAGALIGGNKLLACGNGGSAADASHLTTEFVCRFMKDRRPFPAINLGAHGSDLTAIGNDYAFADVFARQVHAFGVSGDAIMVFTTSGKSENIRRALMTARERGVKSIAMLGRDGGTCTGLADVEMIVRHPVTARIQEGHKLLLHTVCEIVEQKFEAAGATAY